MNLFLSFKWWGLVIKFEGELFFNRFLYFYLVWVIFQYSSVQYFYLISLANKNYV